MVQLVKRIKKQYLEIGILLLLILISDLIILFDFISKKYVYSFRGWGYDTYHQFIPELELIYQIIKEKRFGLMCFQDGLGIDVISIQRWITDPFTLLILVVALISNNGRIISELMVTLPIMVSLCGSIVCYIFLKRYIRSAKAITLASYMYGLCGYLFSTGTHYWFASFLVYFPLLLIAIDKIIYEQKYNIFIAMVFVIAIHGAYGAFPIFISGGMYLLYKVLGLNKNRNDIVKMLLRVAIVGIIAIMMAAFLFVPNLYEMVEVSGRIENTSLSDKVFQSLKIIDFPHFATALSRLFSNNLAGSVDDWHGVQVWFCAYPYFFSILFIFLAVQYIRFLFAGYTNRKERILRGVGVATVIFTIFTNFVPELFNLFNYNQWRMIYVLLPFWAYISAQALENMIFKHFFSYSMNIGCGVICLFVLYFAYKMNYIEKGKIYYQCVFFVCVFMLLLFIFNSEGVRAHRKLYNLSYTVLLLLVATNLILDHRFSIVGGASPVTYDKMKGYYSDAFISESLEQISKKHGESLIRVDRTYLGTSSDTCWSYVIPCRTVTMYNSILNAYTKEYMTYMVNYNNARQTDFKIIFAIYDYGSYFDAARAAMLGLKYVMTDTKRELDDWELLYENDGKYTYENTTIETGGILYDTYISEEQYEKLSTIEKACIEGQAVVLNSEAEYSYGRLNERLWNRIIVYNQSDWYQDNSDGRTRIVIPINSDVFGREKERNIFSFYLTSDVASNISVKLLIGNTEHGEGKKTYGFAAKEKKEITGLLPDDCTAIEVCADTFTRLDLENVCLFTAPIAYLGDVQLFNEKMGNVIYGEVQASKQQILYCSIPYLRGWKAYIDGKEAKIFKANYGFMAIEMPEGKHMIELVYKNPVIYLSIVISCVGVVGLGIYIFYFHNKPNETSYE